MVARNCHGRKYEKEIREVKDKMEEFELSRMGMLTTVEWCGPVTMTSHHMKKGRVSKGLGIRDCPLNIYAQIKYFVFRFIQIT